MRDRLLDCLVHEIRDEVMERYVTERRLVELQTEHIVELAGALRSHADETSKRLTRLVYWTAHPAMGQRLTTLLSVADDSPWIKYLDRDCPPRDAVRW